MKYEFSFYKKEKDFEEVEELVLRSYEWEYPVWGISRHEFVMGLHPSFTGQHHALAHTVGVYRLNGKMVACVINEGNYDGEAFFLFDSKERAEDRELLVEMIRYAKTNAYGLRENQITRFSTLYIPEWNTLLKETALQCGYVKNGDFGEERNILLFENKVFDINLPEGYSIVDGNTTPDFYLSNTHRHSFGYGPESYACEHGEQAFRELRTMKHYRKELDLCVLDNYKRPVAMAIVWYDERMPYCELEPMAVVWWERRKGIGTALLHELSNRVQKMFPKCIGMLGGNQEFYKKIGYKQVDKVPQYSWDLDVYISWDKESADKDYAKEV